MGYEAGFNSKTDGSNIFIGYQAGLNNNNGCSNTLVGYQAGANETGSNRLYIANSAPAMPLIYGEFNTPKMTINGDLNVVGPSGQFCLSNTTANNTTKISRLRGS